MEFKHEPHFKTRIMARESGRLMKSVETQICMRKIDGTSQNRSEKLGENRSGD